MKKYYKEIILVIALLFIAIVIYLIFSFSSVKGSKVCIYVDGKLYEELILREDSVKTITTKYGTNVIKIENETVVVESASCDNQICVNHVKISKVGESIICLPNRLVISIEDNAGDKNNSGINGDLDGVAK